MSESSNGRMSYKRGVGDKVFTTGQISKMLFVAPRTVSKWIDSGKLKGYRIPGCCDRRVQKKSLIQFLEQEGLPMPESFNTQTILVGNPDNFKGIKTDLILTSLFELGYRIDKGAGHHRFIIDAQEVMRSEALMVGMRLREFLPKCYLMGIALEDERNLEEWYGYNKVFVRPFDPELLFCYLASSDDM